MKKIAVFNHKGGVSKTTTTFNIGWMLANKGYKVLLVDADSQCNLTLYCVGVNNYKDLVIDKKGDNIKDALEPAFLAKPRLIEAVNCLPIKKNNNVFLLPGHLDLSEYEVSLGVSFQLSNAFGTMKNLPGSFNYLIEETAAKLNVDYVLIDMNPSLSAINQDLITCSDYFLVPTSPDLFSLMAIKSLSRILPSWEKWAKEARNTFADAEYPLPRKTPKFLGYTINDFNLTEGSKPTSAFASIMDEIGSVVENELLPALASQDMLLPNAKYETAYTLNTQLKSQRPIKKFCIGEISNFNKLIALSNKQSIPVFELNPHQLYQNQKATLNWFKVLFKNITEKILILTNE